MNIQLLFRITGMVLGIQLALGGLVTFGYVNWTVHQVWGVVLGVVALVMLVSVARMPSRPKRLVWLTVGIGADIVIQAALGYVALGPGGNAVAFVHFLNALVIYGMTMFGTFMAMAAARMAKPVV